MKKKPNVNTKQKYQNGIEGGKGAKERLNMERHEFELHT